MLRGAYADCHFNPRSHEGSDVPPEWLGHPFIDISTRAPTRGATNNAYQGFKHIQFQPALPRGERRKWEKITLGRDEFQPALPRGERRRSPRLEGFSSSFQPALPRGERRIVCYLIIVPNDFNPRSHEGSDEADKPQQASVTDFNPRSHEGSDNQIRQRRNGKNYFNPRSHEGSDPLPDTAMIRYGVFQPALPRGERRYYANDI